MGPCLICGCFRDTAFVGGILVRCPRCELMRPAHMVKEAPTQLEILCPKCNGTGKVQLELEKLEQG